MADLSYRASGRASPLALMMSGGGARAAYQVGVLRAISRALPVFRPQIITGVSAGAINAASLAGYPGTFPDALGNLSDLWTELTTEEIFRTDSPSLARIGARWARRLFSSGRAGRRAHGLVDTTPLRLLLMHHLDPRGHGIEGIRQNIAAGRLDAFGLTATNYATGQSVTWIEGENVQSWSLPKRRSRRTRIGVEHVMASAALPIIFPAVPVGNAWYGDGGIRLTTPLSPALHLGAHRILAVSTRYAGSAAEADAPDVTGYPPPAQIIGVLMNAIFLDLLDQDATTLHRINRLVEDLPPEQRDGMRPVELLIIRPSQDLGKLAGTYEPELPPTFRFLMRGLGTRETRSPDWLSMLIFEPDYLRHLIEIGEQDALARMGEIAAFLRVPVEGRPRLVV